MEDSVHFHLDTSGVTQKETKTALAYENCDTLISTELQYFDGETDVFFNNSYFWKYW